MPRTLYFKRVDSSELESRFSNDSKIRYDEMNNSSLSFEDLRPFLDRLPPREADIIQLKCRYNKNQKDIAKLFGVTQGAISSRLARARQRLRFLRDLPKITEEEIDSDLKDYFDVFELEIIKCMMKTTCQSKTAIMINEKFGLVDDKMKMTQVKVRHRFEKCVGVLTQLMVKNPPLRKYRDLLVFLQKNLYLLHEVRLPHFDKGSCAVLSLHL